jgi:hypothetical protein
LKDRSTQDAISRRLGLFGEIEDVRVGGGHEFLSSISFRHLEYLRRLSDIVRICTAISTPNTTPAVAQLL